MAISSSSSVSRGSRATAETGYRGSIIFAALLVVGLTALLTGASGSAAATTTTAPTCGDISYDGSGTASDPYKVTNVSQLQCIDSQDSSANYTLVSDIDASGTDQWNGGNGFVPIGSDLGGKISGTPFSGTVNGSGHTISDVVIDRGSEQEVGLFGEVNGTVRNLSVQNATVTGGRDVGALVGFVDDQGTLANVSANGTITANGVGGTARVGVLVGNSFGTIRNGTASGVANATTANLAGVLAGNNDGKIIDSTADGNATGVSYIGGVAGSSSGVIENTTATGNVSGGGNYLGGLVGDNQGLVHASNASTTVLGTGQYNFGLGGLVGRNGGDVFFSNASVTITGGVFDTGGLAGSNTAGATIRGSYAVGDIAANDSATGGLVGTQSGRVVTSYANVTVASESSTATGGLVGSNDGTIRRSYAVGNVSGGNPTAGIAGENFDTINASYWDTDATNQGSAVGYNGGTVTNTAGLTTSEITGESATNKMPAFDFDSTWTTVAGEYPSLAYQTGNGPPVARTEQYTVQENGTLTLSVPGVLSNDLDPDRDTLTTTVTAQPNHGQLTLQSDGSLTYTPDSGFTGIDQFTYEVSDGSLTDTATVTLYVSDQVAVDVTSLQGSGTRSNPYVVTNVSELQAMEDDLTANYTLGSDIDATGTVAWNKGAGFDPVVELGGFGSPNPPFSGDFDGNGYTIRGLTIDRPNTNFVGLFGGAVGGNITNVTLTDSNITGQSKVGVLAGQIEEDGNSVNPQIRNVDVSGTVTGTSSSVGGLVGKAQRASFSGRTYLIANATVNVTVTGRGSKVGGLVGESRAPLVVRDTRVTGNVTGQSSDVGGLVGQHEGTLENVTATGHVTGTDGVGGLIGTVDDTAPISNVSATGDVTGDDYVGGLIGDFTSSGTPITDAYATGDVNASGDNVGGLAGENEGVLNRTYATGNVSGNDYVGGLVGITSTGVINRSYAVGGLSVDATEAAIGGLAGQNSGTPINDSYYDTETTGIDRAVGFGMSRTTNVAGLTTAQLTGTAAPSNATRFDFTRSWATVESASGASYPYLRNNSQFPAPNITSTVAATDSYTATEDETLSVSAPGVLANDDRLGGTTLSATGVATAPSSGSVSLDADGSFTYSPTAGFTGTDTFDYTVRDASGGTAMVDVMITVEATGGGDDDGGNGGGGGGGGGATEPEGPLSDIVSQLAETEPATETSVEIEDSNPETPGVTVEPAETQSVEQISFDEDVDGSVEIESFPTPPESVTESVTDALGGDDGNTGQATTVNVVSVYDISRRTPTGEEPDQSVSATLTFSVDRSELAAPGEAVVLHETDSGLEELDTTVTDVTSDEVTLTAQTDSFSVFAVAEVVSSDADSAAQTESTSDAEDSDADTGTDTPADGGTGSSVILLTGIVALVAAAAAVMWVRRTE